MISKEELRNCLLNAEIPVEKVELFLNKDNKELYDRGKAEEIEKILILLKKEMLIDAMLEKSSSVLARR